MSKIPSCPHPPTHCNYKPLQQHRCDERRGEQLASVTTFSCYLGWFASTDWELFPAHNSWFLWSKKIPNLYEKPSHLPFSLLSAAVKDTEGGERDIVYSRLLLWCSAVIELFFPSCGWPHESLVIFWVTETNEYYVHLWVFEEASLSPHCFLRSVERESGKKTSGLPELDTLYDSHTALSFLIKIHTRLRWWGQIRWLDEVQQQTFAFCLLTTPAERAELKCVVTPL